MRWKSGASPKLATSSRGCTRCSATPSSCASSRSRSSASSTSPGRTWRAGTSGWFYGEDIGGRFPPPEDHVLAIAERNAWRKIHEKMHEGNTLKAAMLSVRQDTLFWTREVYEKIKTFSRGRPPTSSEGQEQVQGQGEVQGQAWEQREG